jgi:hypothetical protein
LKVSSQSDIGATTAATKRTASSRERVLLHVVGAKNTMFVCNSVFFALPAQKLGAVGVYPGQDLLGWHWAHPTEVLIVAAVAVDLSPSNWQLLWSEVACPCHQVIQN